MEGPVSLRKSLHYNTLFRRRARVLADHLARTLPPEADVLDVGCGNGAVAAAIMQRRPDVRVSGIDVLVQPDAQIPVQPYDGVTIPLADNSVDAVMFVDVFHHTPDPTIPMRDAARVSRGPIVIKDHLTEGPLAKPRLRLMDWVGNAHLGISLPYNYWSKERWHTAFADLGLQVDSWAEDLGLYPPPVSWVFDAHLHFICRVEPAA